MTSSLRRIRQANALLDAQLRRLAHDQHGASMVEYLVLVALAGIGVFGAVQMFGEKLVGTTGIATEHVRTLTGGSGGATGASSEASCSNGVCMGNNCFVAGTPVLTEKGYRPIEDIQVGDLLRSRNEHTGEDTLRPVLQAVAHPAAGLVDVRVTSRDANETTLRVTPEHPIWTTDRGWVKAGELEAGETLLDANALPLSIAEVAQDPFEGIVYNFEVAEDHSYFAGDLGVWVHNGACSKLANAASNVASSIGATSLLKPSSAPAAPFTTNGALPNALAGEPSTGMSGGGESYVSQGVLQALGQWPNMEGKTWEVTHDNSFQPGWVMQTPSNEIWGKPVTDLNLPQACKTNCDPDFKLQNCNSQADCTGGGTCKEMASTVTAPGQPARSLCAGHSDAIYEEMYSTLVQADHFADVTSLQPPDGQYEAAMRNAITYLSNKPNPPQVRLLFGTFPVQGAVNTKTLIKSLTRDVPPSSNIAVSVGAYRSSDIHPSWNHSKIVAADGKVAVVGGQNLWTQHYQEMNPVQDLSIRVNGSAASSAQKYANQLWGYTNTHKNPITKWTGSDYEYRLENGKITGGNTPPMWEPIAPEGKPSGTIIGVGRLGSGIVDDGNQSDAAVVALMNSAKTTIRLAQQDIGPVKAPVIGLPLGPWPKESVDAIGAALNRNVNVYMVLSNVNAVAGGLKSTEAPYSNGWKPADVRARIKKQMQAQPGMPQGAELDKLLDSNLHIANLKYGKDATWPDGVPFALHAKTISVDDQAFYVGSQNVYTAGLQEYGYIVDDSKATQSYLDSYWKPIWANSSAPAAPAPPKQGRTDAILSNLGFGRKKK